jgi:hypothetical protein
MKMHCIKKALLVLAIVTGILSTCMVSTASEYMTGAQKEQLATYMASRNVDFRELGMKFGKELMMNFLIRHKKKPFINYQQVKVYLVNLAIKLDQDTRLFNMMADTAVKGHLLITGKPLVLEKSEIDIMMKETYNIMTEIIEVTALSYCKTLGIKK